MAQEFIGKWDVESSENLDEYMKAVGIGLIFRKLGNVVKPQTIINVNGEHWKMEAVIAFKTIVQEFDIGKEYEENTADARKVLNLFTFENGKLHQIQKPTTSEDGKALIIDTCIENGKMIMEMECDGIKAKRIYTRSL